MNATEFDAVIASLGGSAREKAILQHRHSTPAWFNTWVPIKSGPLTFYVKPDYFSIGTDSDFRRVAMTPMTAQQIADEHHAILPTRKIVNLIYDASDKLPSRTIPPGKDMESSARFAQHDALIGKLPVGQLHAGHKKDVVVGPNLDGSRVAIYGWQPDPKVFPHQPYSTIHSSSYVDYSHGVRLVSRKALLDGREIDLLEAFADPKLVPLVSDQGSFVPYFPSKDLEFRPVASGPLAPALIGAALGAAFGGPFGAAIGIAAGIIVSKKSS